MLRKGFTFIELMITIVIAGILSTIAVMKFDTYLNKKELETESYKLYSFINKYKVDSYKTELPYYFRVSGSSPDFTLFNVYKDDGTGNPSSSSIATYNIGSNKELSISNDAKITGVYMDADEKIVSNYLKIAPLSLGFMIDGGSVGDSLVKQ